MMLGKRPRPPMKRTTSMSEITLDLNTATPTDVADPNKQRSLGKVGAGAGAGAGAGGGFNFNFNLNGLDLDHSRVMLNNATVNNNNNNSSPRNRVIQRRHSADLLVETPHFLRACSLCKRPLLPARDIYMYRGDSAFCSLECRQQQMSKDERKEKQWSVGAASKKQVVAVGPSNSETSQVTTKGETVTAL